MAFDPMRSLDDSDPVNLQRAYYEATAGGYDAAHEEFEHVLALHLLASFIDMQGIRSVLDVGAGTGRAMRFLRDRFPELTIRGVEPVAALRARGHALGIPEEDLVAGEGDSLPFADDSFDLVCEFAVLHHVPRPRRVIAEMSRVASKMLAISDCNFMGQGPAWLRQVKRAVWGLGLWPLADWVKTRGRGYTWSEGDGVAYSYSVFQDLPAVTANWRSVRIFPTSSDEGRVARNLLTGAGHVLLIAQSPRAAAGA